MPTEGLVSQDNGSFWDMMPYHRFTPPVSTNFTWVNQGTSTVADTKGMMVLKPCSVASGDNLRVLVQTAPRLPTSSRSLCWSKTRSMPAPGRSGSSASAGERARSGKLLTFGWGSNNYPLNFSYAQWTNPTTLSASQFTVQAPQHHLFWIRFSDDGT